LALVERLLLGSGETAYNAAESAQHLARYTMLRSICRGKRVLDVACGEGAGAYFLAKWGATSVTAIGVSSDAIAKAKSTFPSTNVTYLEGNPCRLTELLPADLRFDLICSFETIGHLANPRAFLACLSAVKTDDCTVAISARNDQLAFEGTDNANHLQRFDFDSFRALTEAALGPASAWMFGAPFQGFLLAPSSLLASTRTGNDTRDSLPLDNYGLLDLIPPQGELSSNNVNFWVGVWGGSTTLTSAVGFPQSMTNWLAPERDLDQSKRHAGIARLSSGLTQRIAEKDAQITGLRAEIQERDSDLHLAETKLAEERRMGLLSRSQLDDLRSQFDSLKFIGKNELANMRSQVADLQSQMVELTHIPAQIDDLKTSSMVLSHDAIRAVASEVWRERRRRNPVSKIRRWFKRNWSI
jgi:SAM-dependent methyltransferase